MLTILPKWYSEAEKEIEDAIYKIANKYNLQFTFVQDSKSIESGKQLILNSLVNIYEHAAGQFTQEQLKDFQAIEDCMNKNEKVKLTKKKRR